MLAAIVASAVVLGPVRAQTEQAAQPDQVQPAAQDNANEGAEVPKPIILTEPKESLEDRLERKITLDVRDMNIVDVIKFPRPKRRV